MHRRASTEQSLGSSKCKSFFEVSNRNKKSMRTADRYSLPLYLPVVEKETAESVSRGNFKQGKDFVYFPDIPPLRTEFTPKNIFESDMWSPKRTQASGQRVLDQQNRRMRDMMVDRNPEGTCFRFTETRNTSTRDSFSDKAEAAGMNVLNRHRRRINDLNRENKQGRDNSMEKKCQHWLLAGNYFEADEFQWNRFTN